MSKYDTLWSWIQDHEMNNFMLTYKEIEEAGGCPLDHSFLKYKKELEPLGFRVKKISMKEEKVFFEKV